ncbi:MULTISPECIES: phosphoglucosamine mutase [unclassified Pseudonocardia]|uniref:phosphoglucosamine mutase n=1 Tax=unclassified Pseudonocardia TaxID=2619320 RepID=UPI0009671155|nr:MULTISPECIES: phosphoglucosamine mutase [unclassified Pseudonocardia]MBN9098356.1 phosphoglucosamine mutase [Pseudonocardia sp.]OJY52594.1 MAG: phosphoglucosamine mutase [Pseudonocardia sp. 73-21]
MGERRLFGTDGVRGLANGELLTPELAVALSASAARVLAESDRSHRPVAVVGRDPRASGEMLEAAVVAGLTSAGADAVRVGVLPTPAVAYLVGALGADLGIMISASHNPMPDNGIKLFAAGGHKLPDALEIAVENGIDAAAARPTGAGIGRVRDLPDAAERYVGHLLAVTPAPLTGLRVVVDCAHGAASVVAPETYRKAGAEVIALNASPDGLNINDGVGSTHLGPLQAAVREHHADLGIAHDGDADRCLAVDASGAVIDGDQIMAVLAVAMHAAGELVENTLVATVMSNLGLHIAMREAGITLRTTAVGDRYVLEELRSGGFNLGGEQSGHVVLPRLSTTGDGLLTALRLMARMAATGSSLAQLASIVTPLPQVLLNVVVVDKAAVAGSAAVGEAVAAAQAELGDTGRVLLRPSGTEQLVRVMVEAPTTELAQATAARLAEVVAAAR